MTPIHKRFLQPAEQGGSNAHRDAEGSERWPSEDRLSAMNVAADSLVDDVNAVCHHAEPDQQAIGQHSLQRAERHGAEKSGSVGDSNHRVACFGTHAEDTSSHQGGADQSGHRRNSKDCAVAANLKAFAEQGDERAIHQGIHSERHIDVSVKAGERMAQPDGECGTREASHNGPAPVERVNEQRHQKVELFFDSKTPGDSQEVRAGAASGPHVNVLRECCVAPQGHMAIKQPSVSTRQHCEGSEHQQVERHDAGKAANVERAEVVFRPAILSQDARNQKSAEDKEQVNPRYGKLRAIPQPRQPLARTFWNRARHVVIENHKQDCHTANAVKVLDSFRIRAGLHWALTIAAFLLLATPLEAVIIQSSNIISWVKGSTVGVQGGIPTRSTIYTNLPGGLTDVEIEAALLNAPNDSVIVLSNDVNLPYDIRSGLTIDRSRVTIRGGGSNTVLVGHIVWGEESAGSWFSVTNGGAKGTTNLVLTQITNPFGDPLVAGDLVSISAEFPETNTTFQVFSTTGYKRTLNQVVLIHSVSGSTVSITAPLIYDFTNRCSLESYNFAASSLRPNLMVGLESFRLQTTNDNGWHDESVYALNITTVANCWVTNVFFENLNQYEFVNNYLVGVGRSAHFEFVGNSVGPATGAGTSHAGIILEQVGSSLFENNIVHHIPQVGLMFNTGANGNAFFGNFFTNNSGNGDILCHNTHSMMNLWEANHVPVKYNLDGYFGSASHQTLFRNWFGGGVAFKRFITFSQVVGNVLGITNGYEYTLFNETNGFTRYPLFELGFPNIGNTTYIGTNPPLRFDFPGTFFTGFAGEDVHNGYTVLTQATALTNIIWGNFTNFPADAAPQNYPIKFQASTGDTNIYYPLDNTNGLTVRPTTAGGTTTNMILNREVWATNGWRVWRAGPVAYQSLYISNKLTHTLHGNLVYTSNVPALVWNADIADHDIADSILYPSGAPSWWGTNRWPAYDPEGSPYTTTLPSQDRYYGISGGGQEGGGEPVAAGSAHSMRGGNTFRGANTFR